MQNFAVVAMIEFWELAIVPRPCLNPLAGTLKRNVAFFM